MERCNRVGKWKYDMLNNVSAMQTCSITEMFHWILWLFLILTQDIFTDLREGEKHWSVASCVHPKGGLNPQPMGVWDDAPINGATWPGHVCDFLNCFLAFWSLSYVNIWPGEKHLIKKWEITGGTRGVIFTYKQPAILIRRCGDPKRRPWPSIKVLANKNICTLFKGKINCLKHGFFFLSPTFGWCFLLTTNTEYIDQEPLGTP